MSIMPNADVWWIFAAQAVIGKVKMSQSLLFLGPGCSWSCWIAIFRFSTVFSGYLVLLVGCLVCLVWEGFFFSHSCISFQINRHNEIVYLSSRVWHLYYIISERVYSVKLRHADVLYETRPWVTDRQTRELWLSGQKGW